MIQLNLLPDVKQEYISAQRQKRMILIVSIAVCAFSIGMVVFLFSIGLLQKKHMSDLSTDIKQESSELKSKPDISKILTVQNQLSSLTALHDAKPAASRLFGYLNQVTPNQVDINNLSIDFTTQQISVTGSADSLSSVNKYVDTLKYTTFTVGEGSDSSKAFSNVVLSSFSVSSESQAAGHPASYNITFNYDPKIFDTTQQATLTVPVLTTTRASAETPNQLFNQAPAKQGGGN